MPPDVVYSLFPLPPKRTGTRRPSGRATACSVPLTVDQSSVVDHETSGTSETQPVTERPGPRPGAQARTPPTNTLGDRPLRESLERSIAFDDRFISPALSAKSTDLLYALPTPPLPKGPPPSASSSTSNTVSLPETHAAASRDSVSSASSSYSIRSPASSDSSTSPMQRAPPQTDTPGLARLTSSNRGSKLSTILQSPFEEDDCPAFGPSIVSSPVSYPKIPTTTSPPMRQRKASDFPLYGASPPRISLPLPPPPPRPESRTSTGSPLSFSRSTTPGPRVYSKASDARIPQEAKEDRHTSPQTQSRPYAQRQRPHGQLSSQTTPPPNTHQRISSGDLRQLRTSPPRLQEPTLRRHQSTSTIRSRPPLIQAYESHPANASHADLCQPSLSRTLSRSSTSTRLTGSTACEKESRILIPYSRHAAGYYTEKRNRGDVARTHDAASKLESCSCCCKKSVHHCGSAWCGRPQPSANQTPTEAFIRHNAHTQQIARWDPLGQQKPSASLASSYTSGKDNARLDPPEALVTGLTVALGAVAFVVGVGVEVGKGAVESVKGRGVQNAKKKGRGDDVASGSKVFEVS